MKKGLKRLLGLAELGLVLKISCSLLQADSSQNTLYENNYINKKEKNDFQSIEYDTINLKKDYWLYTPCKKE